MNTPLASRALLVFPTSIPIYSQVDYLNQLSLYVMTKNLLVFVSNLIPPFELSGNLFLVVLLTAMQS